MLENEHVENKVMIEEVHDDLPPALEEVDIEAMRAEEIEQAKIEA